VQGKVVLDDPPPRVLQVPAVVFADGGEDPRWLAPFHDDHDLIGLGPSKVRLDERVASTRGRLDDGRAPGLGLSDHPPLVLRGNVRQHGFAHRILLSVRVEEPDDTLRLLERLDQPVDQDPIEAPIRETNAILVMLVEGVHGHPPGFSTQKDIAMNAPTSDSGSRAQRAYNQPRALPSQASRITGISRAEPLAG
jgi:hypothetical protein